MMEPMTESDALKDPSPSPPPIPSSPPPDEDLPTTKPPIKSRRSASPSKENGLFNGSSKGDNIENGGLNKRSPSLEHLEEEKTTNGTPSAADEKEKVNGNSGICKPPEEESLENGDDEQHKTFGQGSGGGVAKIVDEIEKYNSLGRAEKRKSKIDHEDPSSAKPAVIKADMVEVQLNETPLSQQRRGSKGGLSPIETAVLREMPVDVEIENGDNSGVVMRSPRRHNDSNSRHNRNENGGMSSEEDSPRKSSVKRTPTMEFKKQCSKIVRIRTKILQNLGKADKTTDEVFDEYEVNFTRQQNNANRLHKEVTNYLRCARALHGASKALFETLSEVYETDWTGSDLIYAQAQNSDMLWSDFVNKLQDQTVAPLTAYQIQFPELRKKIDKRGRKLVDYDSNRHQLEALQRSNRRDEYKLARCRDQLEQARTTYDSLNKELYEELPSIYDQRVSRTAESLQTLYAAEATFMRESAKISQELEAITEKLSNEGRQGKYRTSRGTPVTPRPVSITSPPVITAPQQRATGPKEEIGRPYEEIQFDDGAKVNGNAAVGTKIPPGANTAGLPSGVLYQVRTTYKYEREDVDELSFEVGEVINVVEYEDPEEQEEGWLCGTKVATNEKGLFPANFTRPI